MVLESMRRGDFEQVVYCNDRTSGLRAIVSLHSTRLGPGVGGCRMWNYANEQEALTDVLNLSKGMTYKASISGLNWGGGKAVIMGDPKNGKSKAMLERFGEFVDRLGGNYVTAKDVGIGAEDLATIETKTKHVLGIEGKPGSSGDPSPCTSWGVYHGMKAAVEFANGSPSLKGVRVALQGLGSVAYYLLEHLQKEGAVLTGCDPDPAMVERAQKSGPITIVHSDAIFDVDCDVFSPSALGGAINKKTIGRIKAKIVAGAANNQLASPEEGDELHRKGVVYAPDYAINAGGLINIYHERDSRGYSKARAFDHAAQIGQTIRKILSRSREEKLPTYRVADRMAEERVLAGR